MHGSKENTKEAYLERCLTAFNRPGMDMKSEFTLLNRAYSDQIKGYMDGSDVSSPISHLDERRNLYLNVAKKKSEALGAELVKIQEKDSLYSILEILMGEVNQYIPSSAKKLTKDSGEDNISEARWITHQKLPENVYSEVRGLFNQITFIYDNLKQLPTTDGAFEKATKDNLDFFIKELELQKEKVAVERKRYEDAQTRAKPLALSGLSKGIASGVGIGASHSIAQPRRRTRPIFNKPLGTGKMTMG